MSINAAPGRRQLSDFRPLQKILMVIELTLLASDQRRGIHLESAPRSSALFENPSMSNEG